MTKSTSTGITWQDPPGLDNNKGRRYNDVFSELADNPGRWALIGTFSSMGSTYGCVHRLRKVYPGFEIVSRKGDQGGGLVYARRPE